MKKLIIVALCFAAGYFWFTQVWPHFLPKAGGKTIYPWSGSQLTPTAKPIVKPANRPVADSPIIRPLALRPATGTSIRTIWIRGR